MPETVYRSPLKPWSGGRLSAFEFYFSFFGLILGIAVANVAIGFGRLWRARERVGVCLPLLGAWLLSHAVMNWDSTWDSLQAVPVSPASLFVGLFEAMPYVVVSTVMFPDDTDRHGSLDEFYLSHSRLVMAAMATPTFAGMIGYVVIFNQRYTPQALLDLFLLFGLIPLVLFFWRNLRVHQIGLALAVAILMWRLFR